MKLNSDNDKIVKGVVFGDEENASKDSNMQFRIFIKLTLMKQGQVRALFEN